MNSLRKREMGCICLLPLTDEDKKNNEIDKQIRADKLKRSECIQILACGTGDSGKTTLIRQMKIIHLGGYTVTERREFMPFIIRNIAKYTHALLEKIVEKILDNTLSIKGLEYLETPEECKRMLQIFENMQEIYYSDSPAILGSVLRELLNKSEFWMLLNEYRSELNIPDGFECLLQQFGAISEKGHVPTNQEILSTKLVTRGLWEIKFEAKGTPFLMYDVGGQKVERKNWCSLYDDAVCVIYIVAISGYDQFLEEGDGETNRLLDSIENFRVIRTEPKLKNKPLILFLNKVDIFEEKIKTRPLTVCFPECPEHIACDSAKAKEYIKEKLWAGEQPLMSFTRYTCARDTKYIETVFDGVREFCLNRDLIAAGLRESQPME